MKKAIPETAAFNKFIRETYPPGFFSAGSMTHIPGPQYRSELRAAFLAGQRDKKVIKERRTK